MKKRIKIAALLIVVLLLCGCGGTHKNTTGRNDYKASKISYNCTYEESDESKKINLNLDFVFNKDNHKAIVYYKTVYTYNNTITDEKYSDIIWELESPKCNIEGNCNERKMDLGVTKLGYGTTIERKERVITFTYYKTYGETENATDEFIEKSKKEYIKNGYKCQ